MEELHREVLRPLVHTQMGTLASHQARPKPEAPAEYPTWALGAETIRPSSAFPGQSAELDQRLPRACTGTHEMPAPQAMILPTMP